MTTPKISVYSLSDLKNTTDDALPNYLNSLKFKQSHYLADVRLALGYSAVVIAAITFYADYKLGWDATKFWTLWAVVAYFILNGALTYWIWGVEKGTIFAGEHNKTHISISSSVNKHNPTYNLQVFCDEPGKQRQTMKLSAPFTRWFDSDGYFVAKPFQQWLASEIPPIAKADPQKAGNSTTETKSLTGVEDHVSKKPDDRNKAASSARSRKAK
ncbi:MAG: hypothetical protein Q9220_003284 [cf. Caloplaca sp. 1 TL-2023]